MADEVQRLRASLARMRSGHGRRYGAEIRGRISRVVRQMREDGASWRVVSETLGMPLETVRRIYVGHQEARPGFVPVEVTSEIRRVELAVVTPGGYRVEGLDLDAAVTLLARLA